MDFLSRRRHHLNVGHLVVVITVCISCLLMADMSTATYSRWCTQQETMFSYSGNSQGLCGPQLSSALSFLCQTRGYNGRSKRATSADQSRDSGDAILAGLMDPHGAGSAQQGPSSFLDRPNALAFLQHKRQWSDGRVQGIICECCVNSCTLDELRTYCRQ